MMRWLGSAGLGFGQVFVLVFGFLVSSALIFLFGIWIGRAWMESRLIQEERIVRLPMPTPAERKQDDTGEEVDLSFYRALKEKAYQRLQEAPTPIPAAPAPIAKQVSTPMSAATSTGRQSAEKPKGASTSVPTAPAKRLGSAQPEQEWADAGWTVQVNATTNVQQATELARSLRAKGYQAYTVQAPLRGQTWYRVRVGRFASRDKAKEMQMRLKTREHLVSAYVTPK